MFRSLKPKIGLLIFFLKSICKNRRSPPPLRLLSISVHRRPTTAIPLYNFFLSLIYYIKNTRELRQQEENRATSKLNFPTENLTFCRIIKFAFDIFELAETGFCVDAYVSRLLRQIKIDRTELDSFLKKTQQLFPKFRRRTGAFRTTHKSSATKGGKRGKSRANTKYLNLWRLKHRSRVINQSVKPLTCVLGVLTNYSLWSFWTFINFPASVPTSMIYF